MATYTRANDPARVPLLDLVMLVDDDDTTNFINRRLLMDRSREVLTMKDGRQALAYLKQVCLPSADPSRKCPDLIFLDIKMPVMDGFVFLEQYEQLRLPEKAPVLLMLSSSASFYDLERLKQYRSVRRHVTKPLDRYELRDIMSEFFGQ